MNMMGSRFCKERKKLWVSSSGRSYEYDGELVKMI